MDMLLYQCIKYKIIPTEEMKIPKLTLTVGGRARAAAQPGHRPRE